MKRLNDQNLKQAIEEMLNAYKLKSKLNEFRLLESWEKVLGKTIANRTTDLYIKNKILFVKLNSSVIREELYNSKENIVSLLNKEAGEIVIDDIVLS